MSEMGLIGRFLSHECGAFAQFVKYGVIGVAATLVEKSVFYALAVTVLPCLTADDWAVKFLSLPSASVSDSVRALRFVVATGIGFIFANIFCWLMNRAFVFRAGRHRWQVELALFFGVSGIAFLLAITLSWALIHWCSLMTTLAVLIEIVVSFLFNYFLRKFFIFKG